MSINRQLSTAQTSSNGTGYQVNLAELVKDPSRVSAVEGYETQRITASQAYDTSTGIVVFESAPSMVYYSYDTNSPVLKGANKLMNVILMIDPSFVTDSTLASTEEGSPYELRIKAVDDGVYAITDGSLPTGLAMDSHGLITGTPTETGTFTFTVTVTLNGRSTNRTFTLEIKKRTGYSIPIDEAHFPDANFREYVKTFDKDSDGRLSESELLTVTAIDASGKNIANANGIEYFTALTGLNLSNNQLTAIDLSGKTALVDLKLSENKIAAIDLSNNKALQVLDLSKNCLTELDLSSNEKLDKDDNVSLRGQVSDVLKAHMTSDGSDYLVNVGALFREPSKISVLNGFDSAGKAITPSKPYDASTGIVVLDSLPATVEYAYDTGIPNLTSPNRNLSVLTVTIKIVPDFVTGATLTEAENGKEYSFQIESVNGATYSYTGKLPAGLELGTDGKITGTPTETGSFTFTVIVTLNGQSTSRTFTLEVKEADNSILIDATHFPDANFREYVSSNFDKNSDGKLSESELLAVKEIDAHSQAQDKKIENIKGIEYFTNLVKANFSGGAISEADFSENTLLTSLNISNNSLKSINLANNRSLVLLYLDDNDIQEIDLASNVALTELNLSGNPLKNINLSENKNLKQLLLSDSNIKTIDISSNTALDLLDLADNKLAAIDLTHNTAITKLELAGNRLESIDLSLNTHLVLLDLTSNDLTELDLSKNSELVELYLSDNQLTQLDLSKNIALNKDKLVLSPQVSEILDYLESGDIYQVDLKQYVGADNINKVSNVKVYDQSSSELTYSLDNATGIITVNNNPPSKLTYSYQTNYKDNSVMLDVTLMNGRIAPRIVTETDEVPVAKRGDEYSYELEASSISPVTWTKTAGTLPKGLSIKDGTITGTPKEAGKFVFTLEATNEYGSNEREFTLLTAPEILTNTNLPDSSAGSSVSVRLEALQANTGIIWTCSNLPSWLTLDKETGRITGTSDQTQAGTYTFTVRACLNGYNDAYDESDFTLVVKGLAPRIITGSLPAGTAGEEYNFTLAADTSSTKPLSWDVTGLPEGLTLDKKTGTISGTITENADLLYEPAIILKNNWGEDKKTLTLQVNKFAILTESLPDAAIGRVYKGPVIEVENPSGADLKYEISGTASSTFANLKINESTGKLYSESELTGSKGTYALTVKVSNGSKSISKEFTLNVEEFSSASGGVWLDDQTLEAAGINTQYSAQLTADGSNLLWQTSWVGDPIKTLVRNKGKIYGKPNTKNKPGIYKLKVSVTNKNNKSQTSDRIFTIELKDQKASFNAKQTTELKAAAVGKSYTSTAIKADGTNLNWKIVNWERVNSDGSTTPAGILGIDFDAQKKKFTGTPQNLGNEPGTYRATLKLWNTNPESDENSDITKTFTIKLTSSSKITTKKLAAATIGQQYSQQITAEGAYTGWDIECLGKTNKKTAMITGLSISSSGLISGVPSGEAGSYKIRVSLLGTGLTKDYTLTVKDQKPKITTTVTSLASIYVGDAISNQDIEATGTNLSWKLTLPKGLTGLTIGDEAYDSSKVTLSGIPKGKAGTYTLTVQAKNGAGTAKKTLKLKLVDIAPKIKTTSLANAVIGGNYDQTIEATGTNLTWKMSWLQMGSLKSINGIKLNTTTNAKKNITAGTITGSNIGKNNKPGKYCLQVTVSNKADSTAEIFMIILENSNAATKQDQVKETETAQAPKPEATQEDLIALPNENDAQDSLDSETHNIIRIISADIKPGSSITINDRNYIIACILEPITVKESGQHDLEAKIDATVKTGARLVWFANPVDAGYSEDDEIVDFYDAEEHAPIETVPESHAIIVSPWLREGVLYEPVIAVEAVK